MNIRAFVALALLLPAVGCVKGLMPTQEKPMVKIEPTPVAIVTADSVTGDNAAERAKALREELTSEEKPRPSAAPKAEGK